MENGSVIVFNHMFSKIEKTAYPPNTKPVFIWDGECGFCKFWVVRLKIHTKNKIAYRTYQEAAGQFPDIPVKEFKKASRLIEVNGGIYSGPDSLYRSLQHAENIVWPWHRWYYRYVWFTKVSDHGYFFIAKNRPMMFKLTKVLFGERPEKLKLYWLIYIVVIFVLAAMI